MVLLKKLQVGVLRVVLPGADCLEGGSRSVDQPHQFTQGGGAASSRGDSDGQVASVLKRRPDALEGGGLRSHSPDALARSFQFQRDVVALEPALHFAHRAAEDHAPLVHYADVIADLEARGNIVVVNRVGSGPMSDCTATAVRPGRFLNPGTVVNTPGVAWGGILLQHRVVNVDIKC